MYRRRPTANESSYSTGLTRPGTRPAWMQTGGEARAPPLASRPGQGLHHCCEHSGPFFRRVAAPISKSPRHVSTRAEEEGQPLSLTMMNTPLCFWLGHHEKQLRRMHPSICPCRSGRPSPNRGLNSTPGLQPRTTPTIQPLPGIRRRNYHLRPAHSQDNTGKHKLPGWRTALLKLPINAAQYIEEYLTPSCRNNATGTCVAGCSRPSIGGLTSKGL